MWPKLKSVAKVPCFTVQMHQTDHSSDYEHSARQRLQKRWTLTQAQLSPTRTESAVSRKVYQHRTVCSDQSHRTHRSSAPRPKLLQTPFFTDALGRRPALASPSATRRAKQMLALLSLSGEASAASLRTASVTSPLRLSGEPPDSRRGGAVTFNHRDAPGVKAHERAARRSAAVSMGDWVAKAGRPKRGGV